MAKETMDRIRAAEQEADTAFLESPELLAQQQEKREREAAETADAMEKAIQEAEEFDPEAAYALDDPDFEVDYAQCTVETADGERRDVVLDIED